MDFTEKSVSDRKLRIVAWLSWPILLFTTRIVVALIRPEPIYDEFVILWIALWSMSLVGTTWGLASSRWNVALDALLRKDPFDDDYYRDATEEFVDNFQSAINKVRVTTIVLLVFGAIWTAASWATPWENSCSWNEDGDQTCYNTLGFGALLIVVGLFFLSLWNFLSKRMGQFFQEIYPNIRKSIEE